ncbi:LamG domain-containing protein [Leptospira ilyithenensis]|uniref:LamG domain-containing protein n=1 Tax=Leptospira ilyithenensis TaxID=2484901 RepID=A0A4V3JXQ2_9LEPT|nr:LamG domain-containing protein [Leptospira ilyithenensis]TGN14067.1 LamG domain-containing protein [Leptospira ilyithenensis]
MWNTKIVNRSDFSVIANGHAIAKNSDYTIAYVTTGVNIQVVGRGEILAIEPGPEYHSHVSTNWAVKLVSGSYEGYWGYEGNPTMTITISANGTFSIDDNIQSVPIEIVVPDFAANIASPGNITMTNNNVYNFGAGNFSVGALVKTTSPGTVISKKGTPGGQGNGGWLLVIKQGGTIKFATDDGSQFYEVISSPSRVLDGEWHHIAAIRNNGNLSIYFDGNLIPVTPSRSNPPPPLNVTNNLRLMIGGTEQSQEPYNQFVGQVEDVVLWNKAATREEIIPAMFNQLGGNEPGLIGYWNLNNHVKDSSAIKNNGTLNGSVNFIPIFHCIWAVGANSYTYCAIDNLYMTGGGDSQTRTQTIKVNAGAPYLYAILIANDGTTNFPTGVILTIKGPNGTTYNQSTDNENLLVKMSGSSLQYLIVKNPLAGDWLVTLTAPQNIGFNFDLQTLPSRDIPTTIMNTLGSIYSPGSASRYLAKRLLSENGSGFDTALAFISMSGFAALLVLTMPAAAAGGAILTTPVLATAAVTAAANALLFIKASIGLGLEASTKKLIGYVNLNAQPTLSVFVWTYRGKNQAWGHASLRLADGTHISWWPTDNRTPLLPVAFDKMPLLDSLYSAPAYSQQTYEKDVQYEGNVPPDYTIKITVLNNDNIKTWWNGFKASHQWKTLDQNCSTTVKDALVAGGVDAILSHNEQVEYKGVLVWRPDDIVAFANTIAKYNPAPTPS